MTTAEIVKALTEERAAQRAETMRVLWHIARRYTHRREGAAQDFERSPTIAEVCERDKRILLLRFFRGMTQGRIGEELGVSQMQISRLIACILARLRAGFEETTGQASPSGREPVT